MHNPNDDKHPHDPSRGWTTDELLSDRALEIESELLASPDDLLVRLAQDEDGDIESMAIISRACIALMRRTLTADEARAFGEALAAEIEAYCQREAARQLETEYERAAA